MKLLMVYADEFSYRTTLKTLATEPDRDEEVSLSGVLVGFIHAEESDGEREGEVVTKLIKNLKWAARKNDTRSVVLHSFAHLAESKAPPELAKRLLARAEERLEAAGYQVHQTPFGYFLDLKVSAPGRPSARIFKSI
jgi:hypothetical protein